MTVPRPTRLARVAANEQIVRCNCACTMEKTSIQRLTQQQFKRQLSVEIEAYRLETELAAQVLRYKRESERLLNSRTWKIAVAVRRPYFALRELFRKVFS